MYSPLILWVWLVKHVNKHLREWKSIFFQSIKNIDTNFNHNMKFNVQENLMLFYFLFIFKSFDKLNESFKFNSINAKNVLI